jgi:EAL domain-containing protein (putative c-di-GMP-specific phosphodiesterase class I)
VAPALLAQLGPWVDAFYAQLRLLDGPEHLLAHFGEGDFAALAQRQAEHLRLLLDPASRADEVRVASAHIGRMHAMTGVQVAWLVRGSALLQDLALRELQREARTLEVPAHGAARLVLGQRLMQDLHDQVVAHQAVDAQQVDAMARLDVLVAQGLAPPDLAAGALEVLHGLDGMVAVTLGRPDADGRLQFEVVCGEGFGGYVRRASQGRAAHVGVHADQAEGSGTSGLAWRTAQAQHVVSYATDPRMAPWREEAQALGIRSNVAIPLLDADGQPFAMVDLYAAWPGYFSAPMRRPLLGHLQRSLSMALSRGLAGSRVIPYQTRRLYRLGLETGALQMLMQPVVDLRSGRPVKCEALARLREPDSGRLIGPAEFLPAFDARQLLLLFDLGLQQALAAQRAWAAQGLDLGVSINLPPQGLSDPAFLRVVQTQLHASGVPPARLTLELLESAELGETTVREPLMTRLQAMGVQFAEDDLGSGYSSLLRLDSLAFDEVKIDQGLVRRASLAPQKALDFIRHLARLSRDLNIPVAVEGLETVGLIEAAALLGADYGQGWSIARPMPAADIPSWAAGWHLSLNPQQPRTALGAYAAYLLWEAQLGALAPWPELLHRFVQVPCALGHYLGTQNLPDDALELARLAVLAAAPQGPASHAYSQARSTLRSLLAAHVRQASGLPADRRVRNRQTGG